MTTHVLGVVLCGGRSVRMGTDKSTLIHTNGKTFLQHSYERLAGVSDQVVVSSSRPESPYPTVVDPIAGRGPAVGVATAVRYASERGYQACLVTPVDMPDLEPIDLEALKIAWTSQPERVTCGISADNDQLQPLVAIYPVTYAAELDELAQSEKRSLFRWIQKQSLTTVSLPGKSCRNINTLEEL